MGPYSVAHPQYLLSPEYPPPLCLDLKNCYFFQMCIKSLLLYQFELLKKTGLCKKMKYHKKSMRICGKFLLTQYSSKSQKNIVGWTFRYSQTLQSINFLIFSGQYRRTGTSYTSVQAATCYSIIASCWTKVN